MDIRRILDDLRSQQQGIEKAIHALESLKDTSREGGTVIHMPIRRRRPMSAASRKRLSESMKRRWAQRRAKAARAA